MIVIVDTNLARNENSFGQLLGYRGQLEKISDTAHLLIPEIVIDEIIAQKRQAFEKEVVSLKRSGVLKLAGFSAEMLETLAFDSIENAIRGDKSIEYDVLSLPPADYAFPSICKWAISHSAPFEEKSDKGFKDACIVASIEYYLDHREGDEGVVLCTDDKRMASYYKGRKDVRVEDDLGKVIPLPPPPSMAPVWVPPAPEVGIQASAADLAEIESLVCELKDSPSFQATHRIVGGSPKKRQIDKRQEIAILTAARSNDQVSWVLKDD